MGVIVVDKPSGPTSFDIVRAVRRLLGRAARAAGRPLAGRPKVGHGGTLDPLASGVLPVCVGEATKLAPFLLDADKEYEAVARFGIETDTLDAQGKVVAEAPVLGLTESAVRDVLPRFLGRIEQVPPMYSALKREGRPLYEYARAGEEVDRQPRPVTIHAMEALSWQPPDTLRFRVRCSKGTYVRVLAADLGRELGVGAHLTALRRTASGPFHIGQALTPDALAALVEGNRPLPLVSLSDALGHLPVVTAPADVAVALTQGRRVPAETLGEGVEGRVGAGSFRVLRPEGSLLAVAVLDNGLVRTLRVFGDAGLW